MLTLHDAESHRILKVGKDLQDQVQLSTQHHHANRYSYKP